MSHLSFAPPALETPSRFASRAPVHVSPRSRRGRALRTLPRTVAVGVALLAVAAGVTALVVPGALGALATRVLHAF